MSEIINLSKKTKMEADSLLTRFGVVDFLEKYGEVKIRGSYELDLMVDGDIDIYVIDKKFSKDRAIGCLNELIRQNKFRGYIFYDFVKRRKKGFPKGYYLGAKTKIDGYRWNIDIWFMKTMDTVSDRFMKKVSSKLNSQNRETILKLKKIIKERKIELPSFVIYQAVLDGGVSNLKQLKDFMTRDNF